jgi:acyl homoserine lactone synthase
MELIFQEGEFLVKTLSTHEEMDAAFRLRHEVFSEELKWVPRDPGQREIDDYDRGSFSHYIGVFDGVYGILGHARLIPAPYPFMVEKEFLGLMPDGKMVRKGADSGEITRLCVKKEDRSRQHLTNVSYLIYKGIYQWSLANGVRHLIMVVEQKYYRLLRLNSFPVNAINGFMTMPDGVKATAITLDWRAFEEYAARVKPEFLKWMSTLPPLYPLQSRSHGLYSRR